MIYCPTKEHNKLINAFNLSLMNTDHSYFRASPGLILATRFP
jgi:hypothetical protein